MAEQNRKDSDMPSRASNMEPAEGSRETVQSGGEASGITNRGLERERQEQEELPPRGRARSESSPEFDEESER